VGLLADEPAVKRNSAKARTTCARLMFVDERLVVAPRGGIGQRPETTGNRYRWLGIQFADLRIETEP
jgi:hypothetical protein